MTHAFHKTWLRVTAVIVASFGPVFFLGTMEATSEPARFTMDLLGWPPDGTLAWDAPATRFLSALTGGFLMGWGVLIWCLAAWVHDIAPEGVRRAVLTGLLAWFVTDSAGSALSGNPSNVLFNVAVLILAVGPLWWPAREAAPA
ncbi:hypothetical protein HKCCE3408_19255 [Rhodobacterales bacterium HKCCE3408]|nr:hypothetical protein [Rhodobacterales bacterium HKCCE3408]